MTTYVPVLWLGGGISVEALTFIRNAMDVEDVRSLSPQAQIEVQNAINAADAELQKADPTDGLLG